MAQCARNQKKFESLRIAECARNLMPPIQPRKRVKVSLIYLAMNYHGTVVLTDL